MAPRCGTNSSARLDNLPYCNSSAIISVLTESCPSGVDIITTKMQHLMLCIITLDALAAVMLCPQNPQIQLCFKRALFIRSMLVLEPNIQWARSPAQLGKSANTSDQFAYHGNAIVPPRLRCKVATILTATASASTEGPRKRARNPRLNP